jgi:hypothetical protein
MERLRGRHFQLDPLDRAGPQPKHLGDPQYAHALLKLFSSLALQGYVDLGPSEPRALSNSALEPRLDPLPDYRPLELGKGAGNLKHKPSHRRGRVDRLLIEVEIDADRLQVLDGAKQVDERASEPVDSPGHHDIEIPPTSISQHPIETRTLRTTFGAADPGVGVDLHDVPAPALRDPSQFPCLVLYRDNRESADWVAALLTVPFTGVVPLTSKSTPSPTSALAEMVRPGRPARERRRRRAAELVFRGRSPFRPREHLART